MRLFLLAFFSVAAFAVEPTVTPKTLPTLIDLGSKTCIPCKKMAPILETLGTDFAGKLTVTFIDVAGEAGQKSATEWKINLIPTQIFLDAAGKELFRHEGFYSREEILAKWQEFGVALSVGPEMIKRLEPAAKDDRPKDKVCSFTGLDLVPATQVTINAPSGPIRLVSPHAFAIYHSCAADAVKLPAMTVVRTVDGSEIAIEKAFFYSEVDAKGQTSVKVYATKEAVKRTADFSTWLAGEQSNRCGFCDRSLYPNAVAKVQVGDTTTWGCCAHCAIGVAARLKKDIVVSYPDNQTGEIVTVTTKDMKIASVTPVGAVAWFGKKLNAEGKYVSAGCFHQGFFASQENLKTWLAAHPLEIGEQISFQQSLDDKLKLSPEQIQKACKIGACK